MPGEMTKAEKVYNVIGAGWRNELGMNCLQEKRLMVRFAFGRYVDARQLELLFQAAFQAGVKLGKKLGEGWNLIEARFRGCGLEVRWFWKCARCRT